MKVKSNCFYPALAALLVIGLFTAAEAKREVFDLDEVYPLAADGTVELTTGDAQIAITGSDRPDVHLVVYYEARIRGLFVDSRKESFRMVVKPHGGDLTIREEGSGTSGIGIFCSSTIEYRITLDVPRGASLKLRGDDDDYRIRNVQGKISLSFEDGEATVEGCQGGFYELEAEDGSIEMTGGRGELEAYVEDGSMEIREGAFRDIRAESEDGRIEIATSLEDGGIYKLETEDGRIELTVLGGGGEFRVDIEDGSVRASSEFKLEEEDEDQSIYSLPGGKARVHLTTEDGRVRLSKR